MPLTGPALVAYVTNRRKSLRLKALSYKGGKCEKCGYDRYSGALEFHHRNPNEKGFTLNHRNLTRKWSVIQAELDKCDLLCANCHREHHDELRATS